jgi:hypothetical protein
MGIFKELLTCTSKERRERTDHFSFDTFETRLRRSCRMTVEGGHPEPRVKGCELGSREFDLAAKRHWLR